MSDYFKSHAAKALGQMPILMPRLDFVGEGLLMEEAPEIDSRSTDSTSDRAITSISDSISGETKIIHSEFRELVKESHVLDQFETKHEVLSERELTREAVLNQTVESNVTHRIEVQKSLYQILKESMIERRELNLHEIRHTIEKQSSFIEREIETRIRESHLRETFDSLRTLERRTELLAKEGIPIAEPTQVNISIGRIEIKAGKPTDRTQIKTPESDKRSISLNEYLQDRSGGSR